jgi:haloalkane dehalogenase
MSVYREPFWSYCWIRLIPHLVRRGYRVIAPDFIGFGKSDKFVDFRAYNVSLHKETRDLADGWVLLYVK